MEEEGIGLVLGRATELRFKIRNCIHRPLENGDETSMKGAEDEEEDDEAETLLNICDALDSLETQLSALQNLEQRQRYEKEAALSEIDYSRKVLLEKLKDYKGKELAVIEETSTFAGETVEHNNDLLLPPYSRSLVMDNGFLSEFPSARKFVQNGMKKNLGESNSNPEQSNTKTFGKGVGILVNVVAKAMLTFGVVTVLNLAGFGARLNMKNTISGLFQTEGMYQCPAGRVLVVENGEARCLVKERVEVPFKSVATSPDVNYGCG